VRQISWSPDSALLAFGAVDNTVALWDPAAQTTTRLLETGTPDWQGVDHITWSPGGTLLAGAEGSAIWVWDTESGTRLHLLEGHSAAIGSIAWLDRGTQLASVSVDGDARLWRLSAGTFEGELLHQVSGSPGQVRSIAWSPDATRLAAGGTDGAIRIWAIPLDE
jgi:WD40 repeat protein